MKIWGDGKAHREFLHVRDFVKAIEILLVKRDLIYDMYNIGSGEIVSINELAKLMAEVTGYDGKIVNDLSKPNGADRGILDTCRLRALGWNPSVNLREGIQELYEQLLKNGILPI